MTTINKNSDVLAVAKITGCFGIKGFVKVIPLTHTPERLKKLSQVMLGMNPEKTVENEIEDVLFHDKAIVIKFKAIDDRTAAERLRGLYIFIPPEEIKKPPRGSYFVHEIIGCEVFDQDGNKIGMLGDVLKSGMQDLWEIETNGKQILVPAVKDFIQKVDLKNRKIIINVIEGLLDL